LPALNDRNKLAIQVWNLQNSIASLTITEILTVIGVRINIVELRSLLWKLVKIKNMMTDFHNQEVQAHNEKAQAQFQMQQIYSTMRGN